MTLEHGSFPEREETPASTPHNGGVQELSGDVRNTVDQLDLPTSDDPISVADQADTTPEQVSDEPRVDPSQYEHIASLVSGKLAQIAAEIKAKSGFFARMFLYGTDEANNRAGILAYMQKHFPDGMAVAHVSKEKLFSGWGHDLAHQMIQDGPIITPAQCQQVFESVLKECGIQ